jgi:hypothetical protein
MAKVRIRHWLVKATVQKTVSFIPGGWYLNAFLQQHFTHSLELGEAQFELRVAQGRKHLESLFSAGIGCKSDFSVFELGTGWHPIIPVGMYLCGASRVTTADIHPLLTHERVLRTIRLYLSLAERGTLVTILPWARPERIGTLLRLAKCADNTRMCNLLRAMEIYPIVEDAGRIERLSSPPDFLFSNSTLQYVSAVDLNAIFKNLRKLANSKAVMSHHIYLGYDLASFDPFISPYHFLRFSRATWKLIDSPIHSHNRLRLSDYLKIHESNGWKINNEETVSGSLEDLRRVPLAEEFRRCSDRDLLALRTWLVSSPA